MTTVVCLICHTLQAANAYAGDAAFLKSLDGDWNGSGTVKVNAATPMVNVNCDFLSTGDTDRFSLKGDCKALVVIRKLIAANLSVRDGQYFGTYHGARSGPARLTGVRKDDSLILKIHWAGLVNGDRMANMAIRKLDENRLQLVISDRYRGRGSPQTTSRFSLVRK